MVNMQMGRPNALYHGFAKFVARKDFPITYEITLSAIIWKEFPFLVIFVIRQDIQKTL